MNSALAMPIKEKPNLAASALMRAAFREGVWRIVVLEIDFLFCFL
jgi:hypothetical protein